MSSPLLMSSNNDKLPYKPPHKTNTFSYIANKKEKNEELKMESPQSVNGILIFIS